MGTVVYAALLCFYSVVPAGTPGTGIVRILPGQDLTAHGLAYAGLAFILCCALAGGRTNRWKTAGLSVLFSLPYAAVLELAQALAAWRTCSAADMVANTFGIVLGSSCWLILRKLLVARR